MRAARARAIAFLTLVLVGGAFFYVAGSYQQSRSRHFAQEQLRRDTALRENERLRQRAVETQPEDRIPPAPISYPLY
jgi:hypothetical protein